MIETMIERRSEDGLLDYHHLTRNEWDDLRRDVIERERALMGPFGGPFERDRLLRTKAPSEVLYQLAKGRELPDVVCTRGYAMGVDYNDFNPSSFNSVNTTTSETGLWTPNIWTPIPANDARAGKAYKVSFGGVLGTSSSAPTAAWTPRWTQSTAVPPSGTSLGASTAVTMTASLSAVPWYGEFTMGWRTLGLAASGGTATGNGFIVIGDLTTTAAKVQSIGGTAASSVDQTTAQGLLVSITWGTSQANNTATCQWVLLQSLN